MLRHYIFLTITGLIFAALAVVFLFFPRSTFSELERRELKTPPDFTFAKLIDGSYTSEVSSWFSDSQPFRDKFMTLSMTLKKNMALSRGSDEDAFVFHQTADIAADMIPGHEEEQQRGDSAGEADGQQPETTPEGDRDIPEGNIGAADGEESKMAKSGILIVGKGEKVRALMNYSGSAASCNPYISMVNEYAAKMPGVKIYSMVVPIAMEFYCPADARKRAGLYKSQLPAINHIYSSLAPGVRPVNIYTTLSEHTGEDIYLRTDHHWAPLGAYYAARKFAETAGVHVPDLSEFDRKVIHRFVGTMYGYSKDISVKNAPEDFVYYTPRDLNYTTTFTVINLDKNFHITGQGKPFKSSYFKHFKDGSGNAYLTFMGSDFLIVKVETPVRNGRRLAVLKDSYGNALPGYLFRSFEEVHVLDFRYFPHNIVDYCRAHGITDFLFVQNIFNASSSGVASRCKAMLTRKGTHFDAPAKHEDTPAKQEKETSAPAGQEPTRNTDTPASTGQEPSGTPQGSAPGPASSPEADSDSDL